MKLYSIVRSTLSSLCRMYYVPSAFLNLNWTSNVFTALHALHAAECMQRGLATRKLSVRLSPSVKRVHCDKTEDLSRFLYHTKDHLA